MTTYSTPAMYDDALVPRLSLLAANGSTPKAVVATVERPTTGLLWPRPPSRPT